MALSVYSGSPLVAAFARGQQSNNYVLVSEPVNVAEGDDDHDTEPEPADLNGSRKRKLQQVSTQQVRIKIVKWIINDETEHGKLGLFARAIKEFPGDFRGGANANFMKASRWWTDRESIVQIAKDKENLVSTCKGGYYNSGLERL
ncbi:hypothetical protein V8E54_009451 [Elaphomyces granulatus]